MMNLLPGSVRSWGELCKQFIANFFESFTQPGTRGDLLTVQHGKGKMLRQYIQRFSQVRNTIPFISPTAVIMPFSEGVTNKRLVGKLETHNMETIFELFALADKYAWEAEAHIRVERRGAQEETPARDGPNPSAKLNKRKAATVLAAEGRPKQPPRGNPASGDRKPAPIRRDDDKWCELHSTDRHDLTECWLIKDLTAWRQRGRDDH